MNIQIKPPALPEVTKGPDWVAAAATMEAAVKEAKEFSRKRGGFTRIVKNDAPVYKFIALGWLSQ